MVPITQHISACTQLLLACRIITAFPNAHLVLGKEFLLAPGMQAFIFLCLCLKMSHTSAPVHKAAEEHNSTFTFAYIGHPESSLNGRAQSCMRGSMEDMMKVSRCSHPRMVLTSGLLNRQLEYLVESFNSPCGSREKR